MLSTSNLPGSGTSVKSFIVFSTVMYFTLGYKNRWYFLISYDISPRTFSGMGIIDVVFSISGHNTQGNTLQRRPRYWGIYRRRYNNWSEHVSPSIHPSSHQQQDGDPATSDAYVDTQVR